MSLLKKEFGQNLKLLRKARNITQEQLSEMVNLNQRQITRIENGVSFASADVLERLIIALDIDIKELFDFQLKDIMLAKVGTDSMPYYKVSKDKNNDLPILQEFNPVSGKSNSKETLLNETPDNYLSSIAKDMNKPIKVQQQDKDGITKTCIYNPDGSIELVENNLSNNKVKRIEKLLDRIKKLGNNENQLDYLNLALDSLNDKIARKKLKNLIEGMELIQK